MSSNLFVYIRIHSYIFPPKKIYLQFTRIYSNYFEFIRMYLKKDIHSYILQFTRIYPKKILKSFVYIPIYAYIFPKKIHFQFIRIYSNSLVYYTKTQPPIHSYIFQFIRVYIQKNNGCIPICSYIFKRNRPPIHSYIFRFIRIYSRKKKSILETF